MFYDEAIVKPVKLCKICHDEEVYGSMTNGMCLNCFQNNEIDNRQADIEAESDYLEGNMSI